MTNQLQRTDANAPFIPSADRIADMTGKLFKKRVTQMRSLSPGLIGSSKCKTYDCANSAVNNGYCDQCAAIERARQMIGSSDE